MFSNTEEISGNSDFLEFWEWYREIMNAKIFTEETVRIFNRLKVVTFRDRTDINKENSAELMLLVLSRGLHWPTFLNSAWFRLKSMSINASLAQFELKNMKTEPGLNSVWVFI